MRALIIGDVHLRATNPESRIDDFMETQFRKVAQCLDIAAENECTVILQPGDLCDHPYLPRHLISRFIRLLRERSPLWLTVLGQHDIPMRNEESLQKTTDYLFESAGVISILGQGRAVYNYTEDKRVFCVQGCPYEGVVPEPNPAADENILLIHAPIGDRPLYPGQELLAPRAFLRQHKFDLIVAGDYHYTFCDQLAHRSIVNPGCLVRKTASVWDRAHEPCVFVWDSETWDLTRHAINIHPAEDVFISASKAEVGTNEYLMQLLEALKTERKLTSDFFDNLDRYITAHKLSSEVQAVLRSAVAEVKQEAEGSR
jgi:hypothetical protein